MLLFIDKATIGTVYHYLFEMLLELLMLLLQDYLLPLQEFLIFQISNQKISKKYSIKKPITAWCGFSILPENRKPKDFLMFSGGIEKQHWAVMG